MTDLDILEMHAAHLASDMVNVTDKLEQAVNGLQDWILR
jgi:hypothetical protein